MNEKQFDELSALAEPLQTYLRENFNPHCLAIVKNDRVQICESVVQALTKGKK